MLLLLLAVCGNTANLLLARATARQREMSIRLAIGAGRTRIASLLLAESLLLALAGAALGAALAAWGTRMLSALPPMRVRGIPISFETHVDATTLAFAMLLGIGCGVIFGIVPALQLSRIDAQQALRSGAGAQPRSRVRHVVMALEVALASAVLIAAGLFLRQLPRRRGTKTPASGATACCWPATTCPGRKHEDAARFAATLLERLRGVPQLDGAAIATSVPLDIHGMPSRFFTLEGRARSDDALDQALTNTVTPGYFAVMGLPLIAGRDFADLRDTVAPPQVDRQRRVRTPLRGGRRHPRPPHHLARPRLHDHRRRAQLALQRVRRAADADSLLLVSRSAVAGRRHPPAAASAAADTAVAADLRQIVREIDPDLPIYDVRTLSDHIESNLIFRRIPARMFAVLAPLLLILAATGIYAVVAYTVSLRTTEIGVRLALGATSGRVVAQFVAEHMIVVAVGALIGRMGALAIVVDVLSAPVNRAVFAGVPALLLLVAAVASWWPSRRVAAVDPMQALRAD